MNKTVDINILQEIEECRAELHAIVDSHMDALVGSLNGEAVCGDTPDEHELSLSMTPSYFKGRKPAAVIFGGERVGVKTWREVYTEILRRCDMEKHSELMYLRNRVAGRQRVFLSDNPDGMDFPIKLSDGLFAEADFDTEALLHVLVRRILDPTGFDYGGIKIVIKSR